MHTNSAISMASANGTFRTCRAKLTMSVDRGKADLTLGHIEVEVCPGAHIQTIVVYLVALIVRRRAPRP